MDREPFSKTTEFAPNTPNFHSNFEAKVEPQESTPSHSDIVGPRKTLKQKYRDEAEIIAKKLGGLEGVRRELGLTQRKMCQLLMVDPSAWSRWLRDESKVPPHIFRSLQWYMALVDKKPEWHPSNAYLGAFRSQFNTKKWQEELAAIKLSLNQQRHSSGGEIQVEHLEEAIAQMELRHQQSLAEMTKEAHLQLSWKFLALVNTVLVLYLLIF